jgi:hypothetical protein
MYKGYRMGANMRERLTRAILVGLLAVGTLMLWVGIPSAVLWSLGKLTDSSIEHFVLGMVAVPIAMVAFGLLLIVLNSVYLKTVRPRPSELVDRTHNAGQGPLAQLLTFSAIINVIGLVVWFLFFAHSSMPAMPGAW